MIHVRVNGDPKTQGSKRAVVHRHTGRAVMMEHGAAEHRNWREAIRHEVQSVWHHTPIDEPVGVVLTFYLTKPKSAPRWKWLPSGARNDVDKLARNALDALTATVLRDDGLVVDLLVRKRYAIDEAPGVDIRIFPVDERELAEVAPRDRGLLVALP